MNNFTKVQKMSAVFVVAILFVLFTNTKYFELQYSLMERGFVGLSITLVWVLFFSQKSKILIPIPLLLLLTVMGISVTQFLQAYIAEDFLGMCAIAISAMLLGSLIEKQLITTGITIGALILCTWTLVIVFAANSGWTQDGKLMGPYSHWNVFALTLLFTVPAAISNLFNNQNILMNVISLLTLALVSLLIYFSESLTSWIGLLAILITAINIWAYKYKKVLGILISAGIIVSLIFITIFRETLFGALGKRENLSGRTEIWASLFSHLLDKPLLGNGWARVFPPDSNIFGQVMTEAGFQAFHSHNDLLQWYITTGLLGFFSFISIAILLWINSIKMYKVRDYFPLFTAISLTVAGVTEISSFSTTGWFIFLLAMVYSVANINSSWGLENKLIIQIELFKSKK